MYGNGISIGNGSESVEQVLGDHKAGKSNDDVKWLSVSNVDLTYLPGNIGTFFPNLDFLQWTDSNLTTVKAEDLKSLPKLEKFYVRRNKISSLGGDLFTHTAGIKELDFYKNPIEKVGHDLLTNLKYLEVVDFRDNNCINRYADSHMTWSIKIIIDTLQAQCN